MKIKKTFLLVCLASVLILAGISIADCYTTCDYSANCRGSGTWYGGFWQGTGQSSCDCRAGMVWNSCEQSTLLQRQCRRYYDTRWNYLYASLANDCAVGEPCNQG
jgi:hypothetical protein